MDPPKRNRRVSTHIAQRQPLSGSGGAVSAPHGVDAAAPRPGGGENPLRAAAPRSGDNLLQVIGTRPTSAQAEQMGTHSPAAPAGEPPPRSRSVLAETTCSTAFVPRAHASPLSFVDRVKTPIMRQPHAGERFPSFGGQPPSGGPTFPDGAPSAARTSYIIHKNQGKCRIATGQADR